MLDSNSPIPAKAKYGFWISAHQKLGWGVLLSPCPLSWYVWHLLGDGTSIPHWVIVRTLPFLNSLFGLSGDYMGSLYLQPQPQVGSIRGGLVKSGDHSCPMWVPTLLPWYQWWSSGEKSLPLCPEVMGSSLHFLSVSVVPRWEPERLSLPGRSKRHSSICS